MTAEQTELVTITPYGPMGGSSRVRVFDWLRRVDIPARSHTYAGLPNAHPKTIARHPARVAAAERALRQVRHARARRLLISREATPFGRGRLEETLLRSAGWSAYDFDDALQWDSTGPFYRRVGSKSATCLAAVRAADVVIAGNEVLADWASQHSRNVVVIPSCVDPGEYTVKTDYTPGDPPAIAWVGSSSTERHLQLIARPLLRLHERLGARLTVVSAPTGDLGPLAPITDRIAWSPASAARALTSADVAVGPLYDEPYSRGKCAYKLLQYAASGVPVVASPVGMNREVTTAIGGTTAGDEDDWYPALLAILTASTAERAAMGARARQAVTAEYSFDRWHATWRAAVLGAHR